MKRLTIIALAAAGMAFAATPSYAQSSYGGGTNSGNYGNSTTSAAERAERKAKRAAKKAEKKRKKEAKLRAKQEAQLLEDQKALPAQAAGHSSATAAVKDHSSATHATAFKDQEVAPASTVTQLPLNCPAGTTAQPNGTCMLN